METGFVTRGCPTTLESGGENGYLRFDGQNAFLNSNPIPLPEAKISPIDAFLTGTKLEGMLDRRSVYTHKNDGRSLRKYFVRV